CGKKFPAQNTSPAAGAPVQPADGSAGRQGSHQEANSRSPAGAGFSGEEKIGWLIIGGMAAPLIGGLAYAEPCCAIWLLVLGLPAVGFNIWARYHQDPAAPPNGPMAWTLWL